jgi:hypothetical protein
MMTKRSCNRGQPSAISEPLGGFPDARNRRVSVKEVAEIARHEELVWDSRAQI